MDSCESQVQIFSLVMKAVKMSWHILTKVEFDLGRHCLGLL